MFEHCYLHAYNSRRGVTTFSAFWHGRLRCLNVALILFRIFGPLLVPPISRTLSRLKRTRKAPGALDPAVVIPPPPRRVKYVTVTQDKSPCLWSERHDEYLFGRAKTGGLGQVTTKKKKKKPRKKNGYY